MSKDWTGNGNSVFTSLYEFFEIVVHTGSSEDDVYLKIIMPPNHGQLNCCWKMKPSTRRFGNALAEKCICQMYLPIRGGTT